MSCSCRVQSSSFGVPSGLKVRGKGIFSSLNAQASSIMASLLVVLPVAFVGHCVSLVQQSPQCPGKFMAMSFRHLASSASRRVIVVPVVYQVVAVPVISGHGYSCQIMTVPVESIISWLSYLFLLEVIW